MKKILLSIIATLLIAGTTGCGSGGSSGAEKTYVLDGRKISFLTPGAPWTEQMLDEPAIPESQRTMGQSDKGVSVGVAFSRPEADGKGSFSVGVMDQNVDISVDPKSHKVTKSKLIEIENDQDTLDYIAMWVDKRDGKRLKQEYIKVAGVNAFHMIFEIGRPEDRMKGEQVHFTKDGTHFTLSMLMPIKDYSSQVGSFQSIVSSFKILSSPEPKNPAVGSLIESPKKTRPPVIVPTATP